MKRFLFKKCIKVNINFISVNFTKIIFFIKVVTTLTYDIWMERPPRAESKYTIFKALAPLLRKLCRFIDVGGMGARGAPRARVRSRNGHHGVMGPSPLSVLVLVPC